MSSTEVFAGGSYETYHYTSFEDIEPRYQRELQGIVNDYYLRDPDMQFLLPIDSDSEKMMGVLAYKSVNGNGKPVAELKEIFVNDENRGEGIGSDLLDDFDDNIEGVSKQLTVLADNKKAIRLYRTKGYRILNDGNATQVQMRKE